MKILILSLLVLSLAYTQAQRQACHKKYRTANCLDPTKTRCFIGNQYVRGLCGPGETCCIRYVLTKPKFVRGKDQCGVPIKNVNDRIIGGREADLRNFPWMVAIFVDGNFNCGGSIISEQWILTAAHCVPPNKRVSVHFPYSLGKSTPYDDKKGMAVQNKNVFVHGKYVNGKDIVPGFGRDIALIKLDKKMSLGSDLRRRICLPDKNEDFTNRICVVAGWGLTQEVRNGKKVDVQAKYLRWAMQPTWKRDHCESLIGKLPDGLLCAGKENAGEGMCFGDSGSPLICQDQRGFWRQAGITSYTKGCAKELVDALYTDVGHFRQWIDKVMNDF